jgi:HEAT repeat protein
VLRQHRYQRERILRVLEGFGPGLLPWMEGHLPPPEEDPEPWVLYARLVGSHRHRPSEPGLIRLLGVPHLDIQASAIKALIILADPATYPILKPLIEHHAWEIRAQAARALGVLGGPYAIPELMPLLSDPIYEVRRNAAQSLIELGHAGVAALTWLAEDPEADRFARDMARERLEWIEERGHL